MNDIRGMAFQALGFFAYVALQLIIFHNSGLFDTAYCFVYIGALLFFPVSTGPIRLMFMAFVLGTVIDLSYQTIGIHASASVFAIYLRHLILKRFEPGGGYETGEQPTLIRLGFAKFSQVILPVIVAHQFCILFLEASDRSLFVAVLVKAAAGALYTFVVIFILQKFFYNKKSF